MKKVLWLFVIASLVPLNSAGAASLKSLEEKASDLFNSKKYEESITAYREIAEQYPDSDAAAYALMMVGTNYDWLAAKNQDPMMIEKAKEAFAASIDRYPDSSAAAATYLYLGQMYGGFTSVILKNIDCAKASKLFEKAIEKASDQWIQAQAKGRIGQCLERAGEKEKAKTAYEEVIKDYPGTSWAKEAQKLLGLKPEQQELKEIAYSLFKAKEYDLAIGAYTRVIEKAPGSRKAQDAQMMIGIAYGNLNKHDKAVDAYETYLKNYTPYSGDSTYYYMGVQLAKAGKIKKAKEAFQRVINDTNSYEWAIKSAQDELKKLGDK